MDPAQRPLFLDGVVLPLLAVAPGRRASAAPAVDGLTDAQLAACREYAESRIGGPLDLTGWAGAVGMTPNEFTRRFRRKTRASPHAWFLRRRIEAAKVMPARPGASLAAVALEVGFSSQSHFTEALRRRVGASPGAGASRCCLDPDTRRILKARKRRRGIARPAVPPRGTV